MSSFIPSYHFVPPHEKLSSEWCKQAINASYFNSNNKTLLSDKDIEEIKQYSEGHFDMKPFMKMFKSLQKKLASQNNPNMQDVLDNTGIDWKPLPLIPTKLNAAVNVVQKIPIEVNCVALDPLAAEKKKNDVEFAVAKPAMEEDMQGLADDLGIGKVDLGKTQHSSVPFSSSPYGLDLNEPDELDVFVNLLYALNVEAAFETALQQLYELKNINQVRLLETYDQFKYGISSHQTFDNGITGLPDCEYIFPDRIKCPESRLPDYSDNPHRFIEDRVTPMELFKFFAGEIKDEKQLSEIVNGNDGFCKCNNRSTISEKDFDSFKLDLVYCEIKSVDSIGIGKKKNSKRGMRFITSEQTEEKLWGQNTYAFWWVKNTDYFFGIHRLGFAFREKGKEAYQGFSSNIYKSQQKSAIEMAVGENKKAQIADIKLQHAIIKSLPRGRSIDLAFLRGALSGLAEEDNNYTIHDLLNLANEHNIIIGDSEGFENKIQNGYKPVEEISGGLDLREVQGYLETIRQCKINISEFTGINDQLAGQQANPEGLVGLQKLLINSSLNALYYCNEAIKEQYQKMFTSWATSVKLCIEQGGATKKAIVSMVGQKKVSLIDGLEEVRLHDIATYVRIGQREEERQHFLESLAELDQKGAISAGDKFMLFNIQDPKDAFALLSVKEKQWNKKQDKIREQGFQQQQQLLQQQGQQQQQVVGMESDGEIKKIYAKADAQAKIIQLSSQLGLNNAQFLALAKESLQSNRSKQQTDKALQTLKAKNDLSQEAVVNQNGF